MGFKLFTVPVVDISSYIIGLSKISFPEFFLATFLAALPTIATFYFGDKIYKVIFGNNMLLGVAAILILGSIYFVVKRRKLISGQSKSPDLFGSVFL